MPQDRQSRLDSVAALAVKFEATTGLPAKLLLAQWAVESEWGEKPVGHANYFGIKKAARHTLSCSTVTQEVINGKRVTKTLEFADYPTLANSCSDYVWLITHGAPYQKAWNSYLQDKNFDNFAHAVLAVYATAQYGQLAIQIANQENIHKALEKAYANSILPAQTT